MLTPARGRGLAFVLVLGLLLALSAWHASLDPAPAQHAYPRSGDLVAEYGQYIGEQVTITGTVVATSPPTIRAAGLELILSGLHEEIAVGDRLRVHGTVAPAQELQVERSLVIKPGSLRYVRVISLLGVLWVAVRGLRDWRIDIEARGLVPRSETLREYFIALMRTENDA